MIKQIRKRTGLTQREFANKFGIPITTLRNWEQGVNKPPAYLVKLLEAAVDAELELDK